MDEISEHAWIISIVGDFLTLFGAYWTARAVFLPNNRLTRFLSTVWRSTPHAALGAALLAQSRAARAGLVCVAVGAGFQIVSPWASVSPPPGLQRDEIVADAR